MITPLPPHVLAAFRLGEDPEAREVEPGTFAVTLAGAELARAARESDGMRYWREAYTDRCGNDLTTLLADAVTYRASRRAFPLTGLWVAVARAVRTQVVVTRGSP